MLPSHVARSVDRYLERADRVLPKVITGFYVVGSVALGAYSEKRSDIDFVGVVAHDLDPRELRVLRREHYRAAARSVAWAMASRRSPLTGMLNGVFVKEEDLARPVGDITAVAHQVGHEFHTGAAGSDVSPVAWKVFSERGIACRGPAVTGLGLDPQPDRLVQWNRDNLEQYWRPWAHGIARVPRWRIWWRPRWLAAWGALGPPRLHCTIATGEVISKEAAGHYALETFPSEFHPIINDALAYWRMERPPRPMSLEERRHRIVEFALAVVDDAGVATA